MRLRDWLGTASTVAAAVIEHLLGETAAVAILTAVVVLAVGVLWRRVSILMATGGSTNCPKAYDVDDRLSNYMTIMAPLSPLVTGQTGNPGNATFLAGLKQLPNQTTGNSGGASNDGNGGPYWGTGERDYINTNSSAITGLADALNNLQTNLQTYGYEAT